MADTPDSAVPEVPTARPLPYRWILPTLQLLICSVVLWPVRWYLVENIEWTVMRHSQQRTSASEPQSQRIIVLPDQLGSERFGESRVDTEHPGVVDKFTIHIQTPVALNLPALLVQLPYVILSADKREWMPEGMMFDAWRAMSLPILGILFWWSAGRGIEAFLSAFRKSIDPKITWLETVIAILLCIFGVIVVFGAVFSPANDQKDLLFIAAGGALWAAVSLPMAIAKFMQRRLRKQGDCENKLPTSP